MAAGDSVGPGDDHGSCGKWSSSAGQSHGEVVPYIGVKYHLCSVCMSTEDYNRPGLKLGFQRHIGITISDFIWTIIVAKRIHDNDIITINKDNFKKRFLRKLHLNFVYCAFSYFVQ